MESKPTRSLLPRFGLKTLLLLVTLSAAGLFCYQQYVAWKNLKIAAQWVDKFKEDKNENSSRPVDFLAPILCPVEATSKNQIEALVAGALHLETTYEKTVCLKILAEQHTDSCVDPLVKIALQCQGRRGPACCDPSSHSAKRC